MADMLIIDDDLDSADALSEIMRAEGHEVRVGYKRQDGLRLARERIPDIALLDVEMPILDGPGMAYEMFLRDMGLERVATPYFLGKPYRYEQVVALVGRALAERVAPHPQPRTGAP